MPELATVNGGDKGVYKNPAMLRSCGSEVYTLAIGRHTLHFPKLTDGRPFSEHDPAIIYTRVDVGLAAICW